MAIAEILVLCGFFMIYIVEEVTHWVVHRMQSQKRVSDVSSVNPPSGGCAPASFVQLFTLPNLCFYEG